MSETRPFPTQIDRYVIEGELGRGGFGVVYRARHNVTRQVVALKVMRAATLGAGYSAKDLVREAQTLATIRHKNIVYVQDAGIADGTAFFAMELVTGESLDELAQRGPVPPATLLPLAIQLLEGLAAAHAVGVVHRDIKPQNLIVLADGTLKILDFGISRSLGATQSAPSQRSLAGTPGFMAPEQFSSAEANHLVDIYAAGATIYTLACGELPFGNTTFPELLNRMMSEPAPPLVSRVRGVPIELALAVDRALSRDPRARFQSADEFRAALVDAAETKRDAGPAALAGSYPPVKQASNAPGSYGATPQMHTQRSSQEPAPRALSFAPTELAPAVMPSSPPTPLNAARDLAPPMPPAHMMMARETKSAAPMIAIVVSLLALVIVIGGVGAGYVMLRGRAAEPTVIETNHEEHTQTGSTTTTETKSHVVIEGVKTNVRHGPFDATQTCSQNETVRFVKEHFDVKNGPAVIASENCDVEFVDCDIHATSAVSGSHGGVKFVRGSIEATDIAFDLGIADITLEGTRIEARVGFHIETTGKIKMKNTTIDASEIALDVTNTTLTSVDSNILGKQIGIRAKTTGTDLIEGGRIIGATAIDVSTLVDLTVRHTQVKGHVAIAGLAKVHGIEGKSTE